MSGSKHYRVYLKLPAKGPLDSGHSNEQFVHAPKLSSASKHKRTKRATKKHKKK